MESGLIFRELVPGAGPGPTLTGSSQNIPYHELFRLLTPTLETFGKPSPAGCLQSNTKNARTLPVNTAESVKRTAVFLD